MIGNATMNDLAKTEYVINNTAKFAEPGLGKLISELSKFQTKEQTNYTLDILQAMSRDHPHFKTYIVSKSIKIIYFPSDLF